MLLTYSRAVIEKAIWVMKTRARELDGYLPEDFQKHLEFAIQGMAEDRNPEFYFGPDLSAKQEHELVEVAKKLLTTFRETIPDERQFEAPVDPTQDYWTATKYQDGTITMTYNGGDGLKLLGANHKVVSVIAYKSGSRTEFLAKSLGIPFTTMNQALKKAGYTWSHKYDRFEGGQRTFTFKTMEKSQQSSKTMEKSQRTSGIPWNLLFNPVADLVLLYALIESRNQKVAGPKKEESTSPETFQAKIDPIRSYDPQKPLDASNPIDQFQLATEVADKRQLTWCLVDAILEAVLKEGGSIPANKTQEFIDTLKSNYDPSRKDKPVWQGGTVEHKQQLIHLMAKAAGLQNVPTIGSEVKYDKFLNSSMNSAILIFSEDGLITNHNRHYEFFQKPDYQYDPANGDYKHNYYFTGEVYPISWQ